MLAERFKSSLEPLWLSLMHSRLPGLWASAGSAVLDLLPVAWRRVFASQQDAFGLKLLDGTVQVLRLSADHGEPMGDLPLDAGEQLAQLQARFSATGSARWLLLEQNQIVRRPLNLPAAAEARLQAVLSHEIDRHTPFSADQVWYAGRVVSRDPVARQLTAELLVLPRMRLDAALKALGPLAQGLAGVDVLDAGQRRLGVNLLPVAQRQRQVDPARRLQWQLLAGAVVLSVAALFLILDNRAQALAELREQVEQANVEVREVRALRNQLRASVQAANFLAQTRAAQPTMLELIADLTRRIPDDTALDKLAVNDGRLVLVGLSTSPAALPKLLQDSPLLSKPALAGAVQADSRSGRERFTLTATVVASAKESADAKP